MAPESSNAAKHLRRGMPGVLIDLIARARGLVGPLSIRQKATKEETSNHGLDLDGSGEDIAYP